MRKTYEFRTALSANVAQVIAFHEDPRALQRLTPPPMFVQLLADQRKSFSEGDLIFRLWLGPLPIRWHARHEPGPTPTSFADRMVEGPMAFWLHQHIFEETATGSTLLDRVELEHKPGWRGLFSRLLFDGLPLRFLFWYRHFRTRLGTRS